MSHATKDIPVVLLCGGYGTRIRAASEELPKPMLHIGRYPILWHIMKNYSSHGYSNFMLCLGYQSWKIKEYFLNYTKMHNDVVVQTGKSESVEVFPNGTDDWKISLLETGLDSMTGHRLWRIQDKLKDYPHFHLTYGDGLSNVDIPALEKQHIESDKLATITGVKAGGRFGELTITDQTVDAFNEKPARTEGYINGGFMTVKNSPEFWNHFNDNSEFVLESDLLPKLAAEKKLGIFKHEGQWQCMDTYREYEMLNKMWHEKRAFWVNK